MEGWIKLYRSISSKAYYKKDSERVHLWIHLLLKAAHTGKEELLGGKPIFCKPGQFTTGRKQLSLETGINESKIERILTYFDKTEQQIEQRKTSLNRLITVANWSEFQFNEQPIEQQPNSDRTTIEQQPNTLLECKESNNDNNTLQSNDCPPEKKKRAPSKKKEKDITTEKDTELNRKAREIFEARYFREAKIKYYWTSKDAGNLPKLLNALKFQRTQKGLSNDDNTEVLAALSTFINSAVKDEYIKKKLSIAILYSNFNEIVAKAKAEELKRRQQDKEGGNNGTGTSEQRVDSGAVGESKATPPKDYSKRFGV